MLHCTVKLWLVTNDNFQSDKVDMFWNKRGTGVLLMTSTEVDKSGSSYYGKQALHFISTKGETAMVLLSKSVWIYSELVFVNALSGSKDSCLFADNMICCYYFMYSYIDSKVWYLQNVFVQAEKALSTVWNGVRRALSSALFMASCLQKLLFLILNVSLCLSLALGHGIAATTILREIISFSCYLLV